MRRALASAACLAATLAAAGPAAASTPQSHPFLTRDPAGLQAAKQRAEAEGALGSPLRALESPRPAARNAWVVPGLNQPGIAASCSPTTDTCGAPPDPTGGVGPNDYIEIVNSRVGLYSKSTLAQTASRPIDQFVGSNNHNVFDPQIQFDPQANRWFYVADDCATDCATNNALAYGFSKTADPSNLTTDWCNYSIDSDPLPQGDLFDDYPKLGHNDTHLIIGTNVFNTADFVTARVWTVAKPAFGDIAGGCPAQPAAHHYTGGGSAGEPVADQTGVQMVANPLKTSDDDVAVTPVPADTVESAVNGYVLAADSPTGSAATQLMAWHVNAAGALIRDGNIGVTGFQIPANVPQPGTSDRLDASDTRLTQAVARTDPDAAGGAGALAVWTQHTIDGPGGRSAVRWYELLPATLTRRQEGDITDATSFVFNGAVSPSMAGNEAGIQYNVGGSSQLAQIRASSRVSSTTLGSMVGEVALGTSTNADQDFTCPSNDATAPSCRWGDYAGLTPDPADQHTVWGTNQLLGPPTAPPFGDDPHWTTRNFALLTAGGPAASFTVGPNPAYTGQTVTFDGSASSGTGLTYAWELDGNGSFNDATGPTVTRVYSSPATLTVGLRVTDANGLISQTTQTLTILASGPTAAFSASPTTVVRGQPVGFDASASRDAEAPGGIASYQWDFDGNGQIDEVDTSPTTRHAYASLGTFAATLIVKDSDEGRSSAPVTQTIVVQNALPTVQMSFDPSAPVTGEPVTFRLSTTDPDGTIARIEWDLDGDGSPELDTGRTPSATRTYSSPGRFNVSARVTDSDGGVGVAGAVVDVARGAGTGTSPGVLVLKLKGPRTARLKALLKTGLALKGSCSRSCTVKLTLRIPAKNAKKLKTKSTIGRATVKLTATTKSVRIRLTKAAKKALKHAPKLVATVTGTATGASGGSATARAKTRLRP